MRFCTRRAKQIYTLTLNLDIYTKQTSERLEDDTKINIASLFNHPPLVYDSLISLTDDHPTTFIQEEKDRIDYVKPNKS